MKITLFHCTDYFWLHFLMIERAPTEQLDGLAARAWLNFVHCIVVQSIYCTGGFLINTCIRFRGCFTPDEYTPMFVYLVFFSFPELNGIQM